MCFYYRTSWLFCCEKNYFWLATLSFQSADFDPCYEQFSKCISFLMLWLYNHRYISSTASYLLEHLVATQVDLN